jgi:hypothetical protein
LFDSFNERVELIDILVVVRGRIVVSETDIFPTLLQYVYGDDPFGTFKKKSAKTDEDVEENEKKFMLKNLAKFILHNLYIRH